MITRLCSGLLLLCLLVHPVQAQNRSSPRQRPWRIIDAKNPHPLTLATLTQALSDADIIFVGEQHDDSETHRVEMAHLTILYGHFGSRLILAMEMFERDGQGALNDYLAGKIDEPTLGKRVRLWPNYPTDYRPLVEYAKRNTLPIVASNAPARFVRLVGQKGLSALTDLPPADKNLVAAFVLAPATDRYHERFVQVIRQGHNDNKPMDGAMVQHFYEAQCVRDDTMAESVANALATRRVVLHINGSFHSDAGLGTVARTRWRVGPGKGIVTIKIVPVSGDTARTDIGAYKDEADYVIFVPETKQQTAKP